MSDDSEKIFNALAAISKQSYSKIKSECLSVNKLFSDPLFPPCDQSLFKKRKMHGIVWKRLHVKKEIYLFSF